MLVHSIHEDKIKSLKDIANEGEKNPKLLVVGRDNRRLIRGILEEVYPTHNLIEITPVPLHGSKPSVEQVRDQLRDFLYNGQKAVLLFYEINKFSNERLYPLARLQSSHSDNQNVAFLGETNVPEYAVMKNRLEPFDYHLSTLEEDLDI